jgi:hypothetical protein
VGNLTNGIQKAKEADIDFNRIKNIREIRWYNGFTHYYWNVWCR